MTTIAYAKGEMAADTLATWGSNRDGTFTKIARRGPFFAGVSGQVSHSQAFLDWFRGGMRGDPPVMGEGERLTHGLIVTPDGWVLTWGPTGWERVKALTYAMGSGSEYAIGAMEMGASPEQAVRVAMIYDTKSGGEVTVLRREG